MKKILTILLLLFAFPALAEEVNYSSSGGGGGGGIYTGITGVLANSILGNNTGSTHNAIALTPAQVNTLLGTSGGPFLPLSGSPPPMNGPIDMGTNALTNTGIVNFPQSFTSAPVAASNSTYNQTDGSYVDLAMSTEENVDFNSMILNNSSVVGGFTVNNLSADFIGMNNGSLVQAVYATDSGDNGFVFAVMATAFTDGDIAFKPGNIEAMRLRGVDGNISVQNFFVDTGDVVTLDTNGRGLGDETGNINVTWNTQGGTAAWTVSQGANTYGLNNIGLLNATSFAVNNTLGVSCAAGTVNLVTFEVTNGIVTHC